jgi:hypothetical protein
MDTAGSAPQLTNCKQLSAALTHNLPTNQLGTQLLPRAWCRLQIQQGFGTHCHKQSMRIPCHNRCLQPYTPQQWLCPWCLLLHPLFLRGSRMRATVRWLRLETCLSSGPGLWRCLQTHKFSQPLAAEQFVTKNIEATRGVGKGALQSNSDP